MGSLDDPEEDREDTPETDVNTSPREDHYEWQREKSAAVKMR